MVLLPSFMCLDNGDVINEFNLDSVDLRNASPSEITNFLNNLTKIISEENKYISEALQKYIHDCSGKGIRFQTATVEGFAQFLREEAGKDPVLAMRIVDQSLDKGWKRLYKLKNYGGAGENIERVPYKPEDLAKDEKGELVVY